MFLLLAAAVASAGELRIVPSPGATVEALPAITPGRVDVLVHKNRTNLRPQVQDGGDGLRSVRALDLGGDWVLTAWLLHSEDAGVVVADGDGWRFVVGPAEAPPPPPPIVPPTLAELRDPALVVAPCTTTPLPLEPLVGRDAIWGFSPLDFDLALPVDPVLEPDDTSWEALDHTRLAMLRNSGEAERAPLTYRLGAIERALGQAREAAYYFDLAARSPIGVGGFASLQRAEALLRVRNWDAAIASAWTAADQGAPEEAVLEVLGVAALADVGPSPVALGRALAVASPRPEIQLLAGTLLSRERCGVEALPIFRAVEPTLTGERQQVDRLLLADAELLAGDPIAAGPVLARIDQKALRPEWKGLVHARSRLVPLLSQTPDQWLASLPTLQRAATEVMPEGGESLWILGQIYEKLGEERGALDAYAALVDGHRQLARGEPGRRLLAMWEERTRLLFAEGRVTDALGLHAQLWRPAMADGMTDPGPLPRLALAYADAGLTQRALEVWEAVTDIQGRHGLDTLPSALEVARLYLRMGRYEEAYDAATWILGQKPVDPGADAVTAEALEHLDRVDEARARWTALRTDPQWQAVADGRLGLLAARGGDCAAAIPSLRAAVPWLLLNSTEWTATQGALDRCLVATGAAAEASAPPTDPTLAALAKEDAAAATFADRLAPRLR